MNSNRIKIELIVDDKGSRPVKEFGAVTEEAMGKSGKSVGKFSEKSSSTLLKLNQHWKMYGMIAGAAVTAVGTAIVKHGLSQYSAFERELANVSTLVDTNVVSMGDFKHELMALPSSLGATTELTKGLYQALSAGVEPAKSIGFVAKAAKAAKAGLSDTFTAVDAGTTILNAFGMETARATEVYDLMFATVKEGKTTFAELAAAEAKLSPIAAAANVTIKEQHAALATLTKGGFKTSEAAARMATALGMIVKPGAEATKMAESLGLKFDAQALAAKGLHGFLGDVKEATGGNIEKMAQLFGGMESLSVMLALTGKQSGEFTAILGRMEDVTGNVDEAFAKQKITLDALWDTFKTTVGKQAIMLGEALAPAVKDILEKTEAWMAANRDLIAQDIPKYAKAIADSVGPIVSGIKFMAGIAIPGGMGLIGFVLLGPVGGAIGLALGLIIQNMATFEKNFGKLQEKISAGNMDVMDSFNMLGADASYMYESVADAGATAAKDVEKAWAGMAKSSEKVWAAMSNADKEAAKARETILEKTGIAAIKIDEKTAKAVKAIAKDVEKAWAGQAKSSEKIWSAMLKEERKNLSDFAKESTRIYERLVDDVNKNALSEYQYKDKLLDKQYSEYKKHLVSLGRENERYADGVKLLDTWLKNEKAKLWEEEVKKHGSVVDRMEVRWKEYQREGIDANRIMYDAIDAGAANLERQLSANFFNVLKGNFSEVKLDWESMWNSMLQSASNYMARIATETAINTASKAVSTGMSWLYDYVFGYASGAWEVKRKQLAELHVGEIVVPADEADMVRYALAGSGKEQSFDEGLQMTSTATPQENHAFEEAVKAFGLSLGQQALGREFAALIAGAGLIAPVTMGTLIKAAYTGYKGYQAGYAQYGGWMDKADTMVANGFSLGNIFGLTQQSSTDQFGGFGFNGLADAFGISNLSALASLAPGSGSGGYSYGGLMGPGGGLSMGSDSSYEGYRWGGISYGPLSGHDEKLHGIEAVVPLPNGRTIPVEMTGGADSPELLAEIKKLRADLQAQSFAGNRNTLKMAKILDKFDNNGLPAERS